MQIAAYDGSDWSDWTNFKVLTNSKPIINKINDIKLKTNEIKNISSLVITNDSNNDTITKYRIKDISNINSFYVSGSVVDAKGSDGYETKFGLNYIKNNIFICVFSFGKQVNGEESITIRSFDPYFDYLKGNFPSGSITTKYNFKLNFEWYLTKQLSTDLGLHYTIPDNDLKKEFIFYFGLNFHFPKDILTSL